MMQNVSHLEKDDSPMMQNVSHLDKDDCLQTPIYDAKC